MTRLAIVADDLTGALDASAPFAARGLKTLVALHSSALPQCLEEAPDILGISADSRELAPDAAHEAVAACMNLLPEGLQVFKKIDSRVKGNIEAELDAIFFQTALVVPAIPAFDRWVRNGKLGGFGVEEPIDIAARLGRHSAKAHIPDIESQADIDRAIDTHPQSFLVGARGLAEALAKRMAPEPAEIKDAGTESLTFVIGSRDPITRDQITALQAALPGLTYIAAPDGNGPTQLPAASPVNLIEAKPGGAKIDPVAVALGLARTLERLALPEGATLVISGGATAQVVLGHLGIHALELLGEALPGLPIARAGKFKIITKSGGFGDRQCLVRLLGQVAMRGAC